MSKSIKLHDNNYWDSSSVVYNKQTLKDILDIQTIGLSFNFDYVYETDLQYTCVKIGKLVILNIHTIGFKQEIPNYQPIIYGLPTPTEYKIFPLQGGNSASGSSLRLAVTGNYIQTHWSPSALCGDSANYQYGGIFIYKSVE